MRHIVLLASTLILLSLPGPAAGQEEPVRPRVGLVLSGGGARGFAHLGLLKVLDELHVPVDFIAGTSMGAVVGGLYAQGMTYAELEAAFRAEAWGEMFRDDPPRQELPMRRKRDDREVRLDLEVGLGKDGVRLPPSLISGAKLSNALRAHTFRSRNVERFDDLPIPFRAVATSVNKGGMVVLERGSLSEAIRASMAVPGAFSPQEIDGETLVDGGLVRNIPIDAARAMGAEILIVCDVSTSLAEAPDGDDVISLANRLVTIVTWGSSREQIATLTAQDVSLRPDLTEISSADFSTLDAAMAAGEAVARAATAQLSALAVPESEYRALVRDRSERLPEVTSFVPSEIRVDTSATELAPRAVLALLSIRAHEAVTLDDVRADMVRIMGYGGFQGAEFDVFDAGAQRDVLGIRPTDKSWGPWVVRAGVSLRDQQRGAGGWAMRTRVGLTRLSSRGGEAWGEIEMGTRHGLRAWGHHPFGYSEQWFGIAEASLGKREVFPTELAQLPIEADLTDRQFTLGAGARLGGWGDLVVGATTGRFDVELPIETDGDPPREEFLEESIFTRVEGDRLDRVDFPSSGHWLRLGYRQGGTVWGGTQAFKHAQLDAKTAGSWGHQTLAFDLVATTGLGTEVPLHRAPSMGGIERMTLVPRDDMWGGYGGMARVTWGYRLGAKAADAARKGLRFGLSLEGGQVWSQPGEAELSFDAVRWGGSVWAGAETLLGPVIVAWAVLEGRRPGWVIRIGSPY